MMDEFSARQPAASFAALLRRLRTEARLTQEELAEAAGLSPRSISDLERGVSRTARKETARLLADALAMAGPMRAAFVAIARGKVPACDLDAVMDGLPTWPHAATMHDQREQFGVALRDARLGQLIDSMTTAAGINGVVSAIWLIGLTTDAAADAREPRLTLREVSAGREPEMGRRG